jgi:hypothetical protein
MPCHFIILQSVYWPKYCSLKTPSVSVFPR